MTTKLPFAGFLQDIENIVALPNEAAEAEEMLKDDSQLLQVPQVLHSPYDCTVSHHVLWLLFCLTRNLYI